MEKAIFWILGMGLRLMWQSGRWRRALALNRKLPERSVGNNGAERLLVEADMVMEGVMEDREDMAHLRHRIASEGWG